MKQILVATDFSDDAYSALFYVTRLLASQNCSFTLVHVYDAFTAVENKASLLPPGRKKREQTERLSQEGLSATFHRIVLDNENPKHSFTTLSREGKLSSVLGEIIRQQQTDLLVFGSKGQTGAKEIFWGSNTIQAVKAITGCPILAIPRQADFSVPREIAFITDFDKGCTPATLGPLLFFTSLSKAAIRVMHIQEESILSPEQEARRKQLEHCLKDTVHSFHQVWDYTHKSEMINAFLKKMHIDLFAMVQHNRSFLERLLREPVIKDVSMYADIPFLILPERVEDSEGSAKTAKKKYLHFKKL